MGRLADARTEQRESAHTPIGEVGAFLLPISAREQNTHDKKRELNEQYAFKFRTYIIKEALHNQKIVERLLCTPSRGRTGTGFPIGV